MVTKISNILVDWLISKEAIQSRDRKLYEYAAYSLIITISPIFLVAIIGGIMGVFVESILMIIPFMVIRKFSGGFHLKSALICFLCSIALLFCFLFAVTRLSVGMPLHIIFSISIFILLSLSPVDSEERRLSATEKKKYKKTTYILVMIFAILYVLSLFSQLDKIAICTCMGLFLCALLQIPCIPAKLKQI